MAARLWRSTALPSIVWSRTVRMSGSGSTLFALYDEPASAADAGRAVAALGLRPVVATLGRERIGVELSRRIL